MDEFGQKIPRAREVGPCPCGTGRSYADCCLLFHHGRSVCLTAEELMRSRYSAYFFRITDYLVDTTHPDKRTPELRDEIEAMIHEARWRALQILGTAKGGADDRKGKVEFRAEFTTKHGAFEMKEVSRFRKFQGKWKYVDDLG